MPWPVKEESDQLPHNDDEACQDPFLDIVDKDNEVEDGGGGGFQSLNTISLVYANVYPLRQQL